MKRKGFFILSTLALCAFSSISAGEAAGVCLRPTG